ncbi:MAG: DUF2680 domain-containing protein [Desulfitobacteriaceae bacterium]|nr:DUF2680 domain-containing protein [Desulfitobacteriaceae bacterium]MDI6879580.1 DUF2680 domain-containing protein [Desulfitobacteriaceae bacterium]MDI6913235.1 DUF2680 domain-containing protein [Desulfitobacteriaceae bacterium]
MKKKLAAGLLSVALLVAGATTAFAATDTSKLGDIKALYQQMFSIQKQIVDKEVESGAITSDQATSMKSAIDQRTTLHEQALDNGQVFGPGAGMGMGMGRGYAASQGAAGTAQGAGYGQGFGRRGGGMGYWGTQAQTPAPAQGTAN